MRQTIALWLVLLGLALLGAPAPARAADTTVGAGTPASCTEAAFDVALNAALGAGTATITFRCGGPATIAFGAEKRIETVNGRAPDITIDGGGQVTLSGGDTVSLFTVYGSGDIPATLRLRNVTLTGGYSAGDGGAIFSSGGTIILENTVVQNSGSGRACGAIASLDGSLTLVNSTVRGNRAAEYGGGINSRGMVSMNGSVIQGNQAGGSAGNCNGGMALSGTVTIAASQVISNTAASQIGRGGKGGGICFDSGSLILRQSLLTGNAAAEGGALASISTAQIVASELRGNTALRQDGSGMGGAIWSGGTTLLTDTLVVENRSFDGGGIYQGKTGGLSLSGTTVAANTAQGFGGGGIYVRGDGLRAGLNTGRATIRGGVIRDNRSTYFGGGVFNDGGSVTIEATELLRNRTTDAPPIGFSGGGAVYVANAYLALERATVRQNSSRTGGGALAIGPTLVESQKLNNVSVADTSFDANSADGSGGAIVVWEDSGQTPIAGSEANPQVVTINRSTFSANTSGRSGGAIYNGNVLRATNVTFAGNSAAQCGGALLADARPGPVRLVSATYLIYATFVGNQADGSGSTLCAASGDALVTVRGSVLAAGLVSQHCAGALRFQGDNRASDNSCGAPISLDPGLTPLANNGGPTQTQLPLSSSPLLDATACAAAIAVDQRGLPRPAGTSCDIGAAERQPDDGVSRIYLPLTVR